jgi:AhpD family alkylhydroperoxidase
MPRIDGVSDTRAGPSVRLVYYFTRRGLTRLSGRAPERMLDPLRMYAHVPRLLRGYAALERATAGLDRLDPRLRALAELKAAMVVSCEYCVDLGSTVARRWGLTDAELGALPAHADSPLFSDLDRRVLDYATGMCATPAHVPDEVFAALRAHLTDVQLVELTHVVALENLRARFNIGLGVGAAGFCAITEGDS